MKYLLLGLSVLPLLTSCTVVDDDYYAPPPPPRVEVYPQGASHYHSHAGYRPAPRGRYYAEQQGRGYANVHGHAPVRPYANNVHGHSAVQPHSNVHGHTAAQAQTNVHGHGAVVVPRGQAPRGAAPVVRGGKALKKGTAPQQTQVNKAQQNAAKPQANPQVHGHN